VPDNPTVKRVFEDDLSISGNENLFRRINPSWTLWDDSGTPTISSAAFRDEELSVNIESLMIRDGRPPEDAIRGYPGFGLAVITAAYARSLGQAVAADPKPEEPAHGVVYGHKRRGHIDKRLRESARWQVRPSGRGYV
jgi:hypothetical protein